MNTYGERLTYAIAAAQTSQAEVARQIGLKQQSIQYLCGPKAQGSKHTAAIAKILDVRPEWLATGEMPMRLTDISGGTLSFLAPTEQVILGLIRGITPRQQKDVERQLEEMNRENREIFKALSEKLKNEPDPEDE